VSATVDAKVLVYASNAADPKHQEARALLERLALGPELVYLFWPTVMGYVRIVTHPGILPRPLSAADAMYNIAQLLARPNVRRPGEADRFWDVIRGRPAITPVATTYPTHTWPRSCVSTEFGSSTPAIETSVASMESRLTTRSLEPARRRPSAVRRLVRQSARPANSFW
jgi:toxin-antitoxin system PIN domain toxin